MKITISGSGSESKITFSDATIQDKICNEKIFAGGKSLNELCHQAPPATIKALLDVRSTKNKIASLSGGKIKWSDIEVEII